MFKLNADEIGSFNLLPFCFRFSYSFRLVEFEALNTFLLVFCSSCFFLSRFWLNCLALFVCLSFRFELLF
jgi:hypothetical protein